MNEPRDNEPAPVGAPEKTTVGNYFVANYPPFSVWRRDEAATVPRLMDEKGPPDVPFGLYVHIPFCRKRCDFCYFRVYTGQNSRTIRRYVDALLAEADLYADRPRLLGRSPTFLYFGGGTPSYLSVEHLTELFEGLATRFRLEGLEEVTFECEPGTLEEPKIRALRDLGVTRLSLGVENFDAEILALNNRAHRAKEIHRTYDFARQIGFPQINVDLIAGMVGETEENWRRCIGRVREMEPDSVTIYQLEVPYNTTIYQRMREGGERVAPVADWLTKRRWVSEAFAALEEDGYTVGSAYTAVRDGDVHFLYRDGLWHGADMLGLGVASFSHVGGMHFQNEHDLEPYLETVEAGRLPVHRALMMSDDERLIRELVLQLKLGRVETRPFREKFGVDVRARFARPLATLEGEGVARVGEGAIELTREGLLQIDRWLHLFFLEQHRAARYA